MSEILAFILAGQCSELVILRPTTSMIALAVSEHYFIEILLFLVRICNYKLNENNFLEFQGVRLYFATNLKHHCKGRLLSRTEYRVAYKKSTVGAKKVFFYSKEVLLCKCFMRKNKLCFIISTKPCGKTRNSL